MKNAPCKDCPDRYVGCHSSCSKYKEFQNFCAEINEKRSYLYTEEARRVSRVIKSKKT